MSLDREPTTANEYRQACGEHCEQPRDLARQVETLRSENQRLRRDNEQLHRELADLRRTRQMIECEGPIDIDRGMISEE